LEDDLGDDTCDFVVAITAAFQMMYVFVALEIGTRRILHWKVTAHPTAEWTRSSFERPSPAWDACGVGVHHR
jgi:hypothetical protein